MSPEIEPEWTFRAEASSPDDISVEVCVRVARRGAWKRVLEAGEIAQMCAANAMSQIRKSRDDEMNEVPF